MADNRKGYNLFRKGSDFGYLQKARAGAKKKDVLPYWDGSPDDPVSQEELSLLEDEWLNYQRKQYEHRRNLRTDYWGDDIPWEDFQERYPSIAKDIGKPPPKYKGGPLEIRRAEDKIMDDFIEADNKYKMGE